MAFLAFIVVALLTGDVSLGQMHGGGSGEAVECFHCDDHGHPFPACLQNPRPCHGDEVCKANYGDDWVTFHCQKKQDCTWEVNHSNKACDFGGMEVHHECQKCCDSTECVTDLSANLTARLVSNGGIMCPNGCSDDKPEDCQAHAVWCSSNQFCQITRDDHHHVKGECKNDHELKHCNDELRRHKCNTEFGVSGDMHMNGHDHRCYDACCDDSACVSDLIGTASAPQELNTLWNRLNGNCSDQLAADQCKQLKGDADVCHDRLAMSICPATCGVCGALESHVCEDTVLNGGCQNLKDVEDVCSDQLAVFICPKTCNMCDELLDSIITSLIDGTSSGDSVPASLLPPSANPSDFPTFDCNELTSVSCGVLDGLCSSSFVSVVCPEHCKKCSAPIQVSDVSNPGDAMTTGAAAPMDTSMLPITVDQQTTVMAQTTTTPGMMTTGDTMPPTTMAADTTAAAPTAPACTDHLNGMDCSALPNVCGSVMALSVCPKYCGLC